MVYVPNYDTNNCAIVKDNTTIRVYDNRPQLTDENYTYTDYFYNSHYMRFTAFYPSHPSRGFPILF